MIKYLKNKGYIPKFDLRSGHSFDYIFVTTKCLGKPEKPICFVEFLRNIKLFEYFMR